MVSNFLLHHVRGRYPVFAIAKDGQGEGMC
jgi:hypothetical protein